jgi:hypothetical protein
MLKNRPPIRMICLITGDGNPHEFTVGSNATEIREVEEPGEYSFVPWVEVYNGDILVARINQHKLEHIFYE